MLNNIVKIVKNTNAIRYAFSLSEFQQIPKPWNIRKTKYEKRLAKDPLLNPFRHPYETDFNDTLTIPGVEGQVLFQMYEQFIQNKDYPLSQQYISFMLYNFAKANLLNKTTWTKLQPYIGRNRGEYTMRSIFGGLYASIQYGSQQYVQFFIEQMVGQKLKFTDLQAIEIIQAFNSSKYPFEAEFKHQFWQKHFKKPFYPMITDQIRIHNYKKAIRIFDAFNKFQYYQDQNLWNVVLSWLERRKGWKRTEIIEKIYPLTGTFQKAKQIFDHYYTQLSTNPHVIWRYNLDQLRLYTSQQMIKKSQINIQMVPSDRTLVKRKDQKRHNDNYQQWLKDGARLKQAELVKDKAQSLAYAIKDRYQSLKKDNVDFSKLSVEQFEDLFGVYDPNLMYQPSKVELDEDGQLIRRQKEQEEEEKLLNKPKQKSQKKERKSKKKY